MKKVITTILIIISISFLSYSQQTPRDEMLPEEPGTGTGGCISLGPDNDGYCTKHYTASGSDSYVCWSSGAGCVNCKK